ncbi:acetate/propionate family kinase [Mycoplasma struthionis]|uniref:Acetate kinase n=1 Tax=Mycoplasma struthionis TaxID=538220 RepID=A0A502M6R3_9MOLU|nr:acetate/propionate family kinase [Mycoplasma struthionis]TPI02640.1 acetate/propionate family kinase [Mycoplasma struthionis]
MSKILVINAGSSSIKWTLFSASFEVEAKGLAERIKVANGKGRLNLSYKAEKYSVELELPSFLETVKQLVNLWKEKNIISDFKEIDQVAFRVVNGGVKMQDTTIVTDETIENLRSVLDLAPVHNPGALEAILAFREMLPHAKMSMHFDTAFHKTLPKVAYTYPINYEITKELNIRKYGFHGLNHHYVTLKAEEILNKKGINIVSLHIGNGASLCAIENSQSIDTSMGFTPLAGIMMGTRSGDIDPSIIAYIMKNKNMTIEEVMKMLNEKSGLLGVSLLSSDIRDIHEVVKENEQAKFALDLYIRRIVDYLITYINRLGHVDALVFTAGVGENDDYVRAEVLKQIKLLDIKIDEKANANRNFGDYKQISTDDSATKVFVIRAEEELYIATQAKGLK